MSIKELQKHKKASSENQQQMWTNCKKPEATKPRCGLGLVHIQRLFATFQKAIFETRSGPKGHVMPPPLEHYRANLAHALGQINENGPEVMQVMRSPLINSKSEALHYMPAGRPSLVDDLDIYLAYARAASLGGSLSLVTLLIDLCVSSRMD